MHRGTVRRIRVVFVGDEDSEILKAMQSSAAFEVVAHAVDMKAAPRRLRGADVLVLSARRDAGGTLSFIRSLVDRAATPAVLVVDLPPSHGAVLQHLEAGAHGYAFEGDPPERVLDRVRAMHEGKALLSPEMASRLISRVQSLADICDEKGIDLRLALGLTRRELEVLGLIKKGMSNREIAKKLKITLGTVKSHVNSILRKLDVRTREDAADFLPETEEEAQGGTATTG